MLALFLSLAAISIVLKGTFKEPTVERSFERAPVKNKPSWIDRIDGMSSKIRPMTVNRQTTLYNSRSFIALPYQGLSNQVNCLVRAAHLANSLNRTLLIPPIMASQHMAMDSPKMADWRLFIELDEWLYTFFPRLSFIHLIDLPEAVPKTFACDTMGKWTEWRILGSATMAFIREFSLNPHLKYSNLWSIKSLHLSYADRDDACLCHANLQHSEVDSTVNSSIRWLSYTKLVVEILKNAMLEQLDWDEFIAIHWRRGDFSTACSNKNLTACWPPLSALPILGKQCVVFGQLSVEELESSNCKRIAWGGHFPWGDSIWENFGPIFLDQACMSIATEFKGNRYSSYTKHVIERRRRWGLASKTF